MTNHSDIITPPPTFNFDWCLNFFEKRGKEQYGAAFTIHKQDHPALYKMLVYFLHIPREAHEAGLDLTKGLLVTGPIGCGKTTWINLMRFVPAPERNYIVKTCRDVSFEFVQEGYTTIDRYSRNSYRNNKPKAFAFDDLGTERNIKHYGNECNVMAEILLSRHEHHHTGMITHLTTNLSASELEASYGNRLRSRMRQMFNLIAFPANSPDKRH